MGTRVGARHPAEVIQIINADASIRRRLAGRGAVFQSKTLPRLIHRRDDSVPVQDDDFGGQRVQDPKAESLAGPQGGLRLLLVGDVPVRAEQLLGLPGGGALHDALSAQVVETPIRPDYAKLRVESVSRTNDALDSRSQTPRVFRMDSRPPPLVT